MKRCKTIWRAVLLLIAVLFLAGCKGTGDTKATTMHLQRTEGQVDVADGNGKEIELREALGLYSGYSVDTLDESYAWIELDNVKLTKMDEKSEIEIQKDGKKLEIEVISGSLFFHITEPLDGDESLDIRSSTMTVGIRGTCGWVSLSEDRKELTVCLLEGKVECTNGEETVTVSAGEMAIIRKNGEITVSSLTVQDIPDFVREEVQDDTGLLESMEDSLEQSEDEGSSENSAQGSGKWSRVLKYQEYDGAVGTREEYTYTEWGDISRIDSYNMESGDLYSSEEYSYDEQRKLVRVDHISSIEGLSYYTEYSYQEDGKTEEWFHYNLDGTLSSHVVVTKDRIREERRTDNGNVYAEENSYDEQGHLIRTDCFVGGNPPPGEYMIYEYDGQGRRIAASKYNGAGDRTEHWDYEYD